MFPSIKIHQKGDFQIKNLQSSSIEKDGFSLEKKKINNHHFWVLQVDSGRRSQDPKARDALQMLQARQSPRAGRPKVERCHGKNLGNTTEMEIEMVLEWW